MVEKNTEESIVERIHQQADPVGFLIRVARGEPFDTNGEENTPIYPTLEQRIKAHILLEKRLYSTDSRESGEEFTLSEEELLSLRRKISEEIQRQATKAANPPQ